MDTIVPLGTDTAYVFSIAVIAGLIESPETYFESGVVIVAFILLGKIP